MAERVWRGSERDWTDVRDHWLAGGSWGSCEHVVMGRIARQTIQKRAEAEGWIRHAVGGTTEIANESMEAKALRLAKAGATLKERRAKLEERRLSLAEKLLDTAESLRDRVHAPVTMREAKVVPQGTGMGSEVEIVDIELPAATPSQARDLMIAAAVAVDKAQLLSGEATTRAETGPTPSREEATARIAQLRDELAERRRAAEPGEPAGTATG